MLVVAGPWHRRQRIAADGSIERGPNTNDREETHDDGLRVVGDQFDIDRIGKIPADGDQIPSINRSPVASRLGAHRDDHVIVPISVLRTER